MNPSDDQSEIDITSSKYYILESNNNYYSTASMPLTSFYLKYQNLLKKIEVVDNDNKIVNENYFNLKQITDRNSNILYGRLLNTGVFNIYDRNDHVLFTSGIEGDDKCEDDKKCFYFMYIIPDVNGYIKIMERKFNNGNSKDYIDKLIISSREKINRNEK